MRPLVHHGKRALLLLLAAIVAGCGGSGDEYEGFDTTVTTGTPNKFLKFFNGQADLAPGKYTLVVGTNGIGFDMRGWFGIVDASTWL